MRNDFKKHSENYYDLIDDYDLIESSFLKQYGIRLRTCEDMSWSEFSNLLAGLMPDTPLGRIVSIRSESNVEVISKFSDDQRRIRNEWIVRRNKRLRSDKNAYDAYILNLQNTFAAAFGSNK